MTLKLGAVQRRVFGVLIEKSLATPGAYPLSLNALVAGCNQFSCRDPVVRLTEDEVAKAARELKGMGLAAEVEPERGARVERFRHDAEERLGWNEYKQAIVAELLLRGPQTPGELKSNASRMAAIPDLECVAMILEAFAAQDPPVVRALPRQPGKSAQRYEHLFTSEEEAGEAPVAATPGPAGLEARVARLESEIASLRREVEDLRAGGGAARPA
ncbi:MAG: DUF480 domain-containing protein [Planctomycetes bacterium]|nr:DUF480 domain-containing protein [Planctomycetota bacterium]